MRLGTNAEAHRKLPSYLRTVKCPCNCLPYVLCILFCFASYLLLCFLRCFLLLVCRVFCLLIIHLSFLSWFYFILLSLSLFIQTRFNTPTSPSSLLLSLSLFIHSFFSFPNLFHVVFLPPLYFCLSNTLSLPSLPSFLPPCLSVSPSGPPPQIWVRFQFSD